MGPITCGEAMARMLKNEGVTVVFGLADGTYFGLYGHLHDYGIEFISPRSEATAVYMAGAYARLTGKLGVCLASNGPGAANAVPGAIVEQAEGNRVMLITSSRRHGITRPDRGGAYQHFNHTAVFRPDVKFSESIREPDRVVELMRKAFRTSSSGRPGVVHVDIPEDIVNQKHKFSEECFQPPPKYRLVLPLKPQADEVEQVVEMLRNAAFPIIHAGSGIIHAQAFQELKETAELWHLPVSTSWAARGVLPETHELSVPFIYTQALNKLRTKADLVLVIGSRMGETDWWGKKPYWGDPSRQKVIQVDIDPLVFGLNRTIDLGIQADARQFLLALNQATKGSSNGIDLAERKAQFEKIIKQKEAGRSKLDKHLVEESVPMGTAHIPHITNRIASPDDIMVFDGGNAAVWGHFFYRFAAPGTFLSTPKMGMLGAGIGQALGAAVAFPDRRVYCMIGDGAMGYYLQDIETAVRNNLKVVFMVACDRQWGMVKINQHFTLKPIKTLIKKTLDPSENINTDFHDMAFDEIAKGMCAFAARVQTPQELEHALTQWQEQNRCGVIHVDVDPVRHLWAPGLATFKDMHKEPAG